MEDAAAAQAARDQKATDKQIKAAEKRDEKLRKIERKQQKRREKELKGHFNAMTSITGAGMASLIT